MRVVGRRWKESAEVAERMLVEGGVPFIEIAQPARRGVTLAELLAFEERWRKAEGDRQARWEAERAELRKREEERDRLQAEARARMEQRKAEADLIVEATTR
jgi:hypothetical protein